MPKVNYLEPQSIKIGFLGDGQLAKMMILEAHRMGLTPYVYCSSLESPAAQVCSNRVIGNLDQWEILDQFLNEMTIVTFESEFVPASILKHMIKKKYLAFPSPYCMLVLQNRESQKILLQENKIPSADFMPVTSFSDLDKCWQIWQSAFVLKKNFGGYDGNGTFILRDQKEIREFCADQSFAEMGYIAEKKISFKRELACIFVRSQNGYFVHFPLVESKQNDKRCDWVVGPITHKKFPDMVKKFKNMLAKVNYVGAMGVEFFDTGNDLLVNELAPRVHNSGHYSQLGTSISQFELHIMAGLGHKISSPDLCANAFAMTNLIGNSNCEIQIPTNLQGQLHLYGKMQNRPGRKMGHINYIGKSIKTVLKLALKERKSIKL